MKGIKDKYNPNLTVKENAELCNCSVSAIRHYIKVNGIDRKYDETLKKWKLVNDFAKLHPDYSPYRLAKELGISQHTVTKYRGTEKPAKSDNSKLSKFAGEKMANNILSVNTNQQSILNNILTLYVPSLRFHCDLTYSKGSFYRKGNVAEPTYKFDKFPQRDDITPLDDIDSVIGDEALDSVIFDLPYIVRQSWVTVKPEILDRYNTFESKDELLAANKEMMALSARKLRKGGILAVKTQDSNIGGKQTWVSHYILNIADELGLQHLDTFILVTNHLIFTRHEKQHIARKNHCYFFVFKKSNANEGIDI